MVATKTRTLVTDGTPDVPYPIPPEQVFGIEDYWQDSRLTEIGETLLQRKFPSIAKVSDEVRITFLWKKRGGTSGGNLTLGKCVKLSGPALYFGQYDYLIWCAADHSRRFRLTNYQVEALLYHELCHVEIEEPEDTDAPPIKRTRGHDFEGFMAELNEYGRWRASMEQMAEAFQAALPFHETPDQFATRVAMADGVQEADRSFVRDTFRPGGGIDSVTFSTPHTGESVTISREDAERSRSFKDELGDELRGLGYDVQENVDPTERGE